MSKLMSTIYSCCTRPLSVRTVLAGMLIAAAASIPLVAFAESIAPSDAGAVNAKPSDSQHDDADFTILDGDDTGGDG